MDYSDFGGTGGNISAVGFGGWAIGGHGYGKVDDAESVAAINKALDLGINIFDTADVYGFGHSEKILSKALGNRIKDVLLATKFGVRWDDAGRTIKDCSIDYIKKALEGSLRRLKTDCIHLYQLHWHDGVTPISDVFAELVRYQKEGKIRYIGCSNIPSSVFCDIAGSGKLVSAQLQFSLGYCQTLNDLASYQERYGMATLVYGVLMRGLLSGKYSRGCSFGEQDTRGDDPNFREHIDRNINIIEGIKKISSKYRKSMSQVAIRWVLENPFVSCALVGIKSEEQVVENAGAIGWHLEKEDRDYLRSLGE